MMAHEPIPYVLTGPEADDPHPVDSAVHLCCRGIGQHAPDCATPADGRLLAYLDRGAVTLQVGDGGPFRLSNIDTLDLVKHLLVLVGEVAE